KVDAWFTTHWLKHQERWIRYFRLQLPHVPWTTNGVESLHRVLKYKYLQHYSDRSLYGLLSVMISKYLPEMLIKYQAANLSFSSAKTCNADLPDFLHQRPEGLVKHCLSRLKGTGDVKVKSSADDEQHLVLGSTGQPYILKGSPLVCQCSDWTQHHLPCKHVLAVCLTHKEAVEPSNLNHPTYVKDNEILSMSIQKVTTRPHGEVQIREAIPSDKVTVSQCQKLPFHIARHLKTKKRHAQQNFNPGD
ncbi:hypothetical protein CAPTEDRAFT_192781, partial [Capitella teleta]